MGKTLYYCKSKLILLLFVAASICACAIFVQYCFFSDDYPYGYGLTYLIIILVLMIYIKTIPVLISSEPALSIYPQGFFVSSFLIGIGLGWIGWDEVEVLGKQQHFVSVMLKNPKETKAKLTCFYNQIPTFRTSFLRIGPSFSLGNNGDVYAFMLYTGRRVLY